MYTMTNEHMKNIAKEEKSEARKRKLKGIAFYVVSIFTAILMYTYKVGQP